MNATATTATPTTASTTTASTTIVTVTATATANVTGTIRARALRIATTVALVAVASAFVTSLAIASSSAASAGSQTQPARPAGESRTPEATSLSGTPLYAPELPAAQRTKLEADLAQARAAYEAQPGNAERVIWVGRRLAYLGRYREAIAVFSKGLEAHPKSAELYRHRGHRYITVRELDRAIADFDQAAALIKGTPDAIEIDGAPNAANKPRSTLHSNIWYHLALAHYLKSDFERARQAYVEGMKVATVNDDMRVAMTDWYYMTLRRLGRDQEARALLDSIREKMDILENHAYHQRLLMYKGIVKPEALLTVDDTSTTAKPDPVQMATQGYGVGNWYLCNGDIDKARTIFERVTKGTSWAAFGFIAAEADLARGLRAPSP